MGVTWIKKGAESANMQKQAAQEAEQKKEQAGKLFRWFLKTKEDGSLTFVDGELFDLPGGQKGLLPPRFWEHNLYLNGKWFNYFVCPAKTNPEAKEKCPICEAGDDPYLIALFTVVDHRAYTNKEKGITYKDTRKLFAVKSQTFELLNKLAVKRGGLVGTTWDVSRTGDKSASVGDVFDYQGKSDPAVLEVKYTRTYKKGDKEITETSFKVADYESEVIYRTGDELRQMGFGTPTAGTPVMASAEAKTDDKQDYADQL